MAIAGVFDPFVRVRPTVGMAEFNVIEMTVGNSQTISAMDILSLSSGKVQQSIAAPTQGTSTLSGGNLPIVGVALAPITTDSAGNELSGGWTRTTTTVAVFDDKLNILLRGATTNGASQTLANFTIGTAYQFGRYTAATGSTYAGASWYFISPTTTNGELVFEEIPQDLKGSTSTYPTIWLKAAFSATVRQLA